MFFAAASNDATKSTSMGCIGESYVLVFLILSDFLLDLLLTGIILRRNHGFYLIFVRKKKKLLRIRN